MWTSILGKLVSAEVKPTKSTYKPILLLCSISLLMFSIGYLLRPVSEMVDEFHDSDDEN